MSGINYNNEAPEVESGQQRYVTVVRPTANENPGHAVHEVLIDNVTGAELSDGSLGKRSNELPDGTGTILRPDTWD